MRMVSAGYMPVDVVFPFQGEPYRGIGGTSANVALILAFLGWDAALAGQIGDDVLADEFECEARASGASVDLIRRASGAETVRILHRVEADGHTYAYTCPRCHRRFPRSRPLTLDLARQVAEVQRDVDVFFFDRVNAGTVWLAEHYAELGAEIMFEPSLPTGGALFRRACEASSIVKHSGDIDLPIPPTLPSSRPNQVRIVTNGAAGLTYQRGLLPPKHLPAIPTLTVDTAGAGDWTTAALLYSTCSADGLDDTKIEEGLRLGQALAAVCCSVVGARSLMRLRPKTVLTRARDVLAANSLETAPRVPAPAKRNEVHSQCSLCALEL